MAITTSIKDEMNVTAILRSPKTDPSYRRRADGHGDCFTIDFAHVGGSCHRYHFCRDKHVFCRDKIMFVATNICCILLSRQKTCFVVSNTFVATKICLSQQNFCRDKIMLVATKRLSRQNYVCRDKNIFVKVKAYF